MEFNIIDMLTKALDFFSNVFNRGEVLNIPNGEKPSKNFITACINVFKQSSPYENSYLGERYYRNKNTAISLTKRHYVNAEGKEVEAKTLPNTKLAHGLFRILTDQKVNYLLGKPFKITTKEETEDKPIEVLINSYFDRKLRRKIYNVEKFCVIGGIEWMYAYYDSNGMLQFKRVSGKEVIPLWEDADHTELKGVIRFYKQLEIEGSDKALDSKYNVEYYTKDGVWEFELTGNTLTSKGPLTPYFKTVTNNENGEPVETNYNWSSIPFIPFKYNCVEESLLSYVKPLIDDYDLIMSTVSNYIKEIPDSLIVLKGYDGKASKEEIKRLIMLHRLVTLKENGSIEKLNTAIDTKAIEAQLSRIRKDIYESGQGVDVQDQNVGNPSGTALKYRFAGLDNDCMGMEVELVSSLTLMLDFIIADLILKGKIKSEEEVINAGINIKFNKEFIVNTSEKVMDAQQSYGIVSRETIVENHPFVENPVEEMNRIKKETLAKKVLTDEGTGYGNPPDAKTI